tara:strand:+ start:337 stop:522 length:186 start_codon:yes stop_codon:yes gene_type:complete
MEALLGKTIAKNGGEYTRNILMTIPRISLVSNVLMFTLTAVVLINSGRKEFCVRSALKRQV